MEIYWFRHDEFQRRYNCARIDIESIPLEQRQFRLEAWAIIILCAIYYILYLPCMFSFAKRLWDEKGKANPCYQILFYTGLVDMAVLWIVGFLHGFLSLEGAVFCSRPKLIYFAGAAAVGFAFAESTADIVLALNRCMDILSPSFAERLFSGKRVHVWLFIFSFCYGLYNTLFEYPVLFDGIFFAWFKNPFQGYLPDLEGFYSRTSKQLDFNQMLMTFATPSIYLIFTLSLKIRTKAFIQNGPEMRMSKVQKMVFLQVFLISLINALAGSIYFGMAHVELKQWMITLGHFAWMHIHGFPPVIYLCLNKTVRNDVRHFRDKFITYFRLNRQQKVHTVGALTDAFRTAIAAPIAQNNINMAA